MNLVFLLYFYFNTIRYEVLSVDVKLELKQKSETLESISSTRLES